MNRRFFFRSVAAGTPLVAKTTSEVNPKLAGEISVREWLLGSESEWIRVGRWHVQWTGWKTCCTNLSIIGQWIAVPVLGDGSLDKSRWPIYASVPGACAVFNPADEFNIELQNYQPQELLLPVQRHHRIFDEQRELHLDWILRLIALPDRYWTRLGPSHRPQINPLPHVPKKP